MKLHKLAPTELDFTTNSVHQLAEKYLGRPSQGNQAPFQFGDEARRKAGRKGRYPPSRDGEFRTMVEKAAFEEELAKGGHGVPLTSQSDPVLAGDGVRRWGDGFGHGVPKRPPVPPLAMPSPSRLSRSGR